MKRSILLQLISALLILLFVYTSVSKLIDFQQFKEHIYNQAIPHSTASILIWTLPVIEIITAGLLFFDRSRLAGFSLSSILLICFTAYIILVLLNYFGRVPCSCGGVIKALGWKMHLAFNLFFLLLSFLGIYFTNRERSVIGKQK
jgi:putative oxidoreductase